MTTEPTDAESNAGERGDARPGERKRGDADHGGGDTAGETGAVDVPHETAQGVRVPKIGLGTWRLTGETCRRVVETALDLGYRHVDTAAAYDNERAIGRAIAASDVDRSDLFLTTKVRPTNARYRNAVAAARASVDRLGVDHVDLLLLHWPNPIVPIRETMRAFADLVDEGTTRLVGVSNFDRRRLVAARAASTEPLFADQVRFYPYRPQRELLRYCQDEDLLLTAYSPLGHGGVLADDTLAAVGRRYDKSPAQVALRWATQHENVVAIPKASSTEHLRQNLDVFDFTLTRDEVERVTQASLLRTGLSSVRSRLGV